MTPVDLSLVPMEDLWEEIKSRKDAVLLVDMNNVDTLHETCNISYSGGKYTCMGLAKYAMERIFQDCNDSVDKEFDD